MIIYQYENIGPLKNSCDFREHNKMKHKPVFMKRLLSGLKQDMYFTFDFRFSFYGVKKSNQKLYRYDRQCDSDH